MQDVVNVADGHGRQALAVLAAREVKEETGIDVEQFAKVAFGYAKFAKKNATLYRSHRS